MDSVKKEQRFAAIYMAIQFGHSNAARSTFEDSVDEAINDKLDQVIEILEKKGLFFAIEDIEKLKEAGKKC